MTSRLDRLFVLLETGSSPVTRQAAAKQIGDVQRLHPHELHSLLNRITNYLYSSSWDTRIAAAQAVEAILKNVPKWDPIPIKNVKTESDNLKITPKETMLTFATFNLNKVLNDGARLMGSEGTEFDFIPGNEDNSNENLQRQRQLLAEKFGLSNSGNMGITINDLVTLDDIKIQNTNSTENYDKKISVKEILSMDNKSLSLSCREKNRAKRKARQNNQAGNNLSRMNSINNETNEPEQKKIKCETKSMINMNLNNDGPVPDATGAWTDIINWPFESFCTKLYGDLFSPRWETRHGAATALRELIKLHADSAGKDAYMTEEEMQINHELWLEDALLRFVCVLALDRFGDFVSDQVIAPVRETIAQVLGVIFQKMSENSLEKTIDIFSTLIKQTDWEVRHGALLGIKYLLVVREDLLSKFLPNVLQYILQGLNDPVDDVGAVAASTLVPIATWLPKLLPSKEVGNIVQMLWDLLLEQDELTSACNSFMSLLSSILSLPEASTFIEMEAMSKLIPRLWPFLSHSSSTVRRSTLQTLYTLTQTVPESNDGKITKQFGLKDWPTDLLQNSLRHIIQRILVEHIEDIQDLAVNVWNNLAMNSQLSTLLHAACPWISTWLCLAMQPARLAFDPSVLIYSRTLNTSDFRSICDNNTTKLMQKLYIGGAETVPFDVREKNVTKARCKTSQVLGLISKYVVQPDPNVSYESNAENPIDRYVLVLNGYLNSKSALQRLICSMVIGYWAQYDPMIVNKLLILKDKLNSCLLEYLYYDEVAVLFTKLMQEALDFLNLLKENKFPVNQYENVKVLTLDQIHYICNDMTKTIKTVYTSTPRVSVILEEKRKNLQSSYLIASKEQNNLNVTVQAALAGAVVCLFALPEKLNPIIKPLMESIKREECEILQKCAAKNLVLLLDQINSRNPCPNNKIISNLCRLLKNDSDFTPRIILPDKTITFFDSNDTTAANPYHGILSSSNRQKLQENSNNIPNRGPGRPPTIDVQPDDIYEIEDPIRKLNRIQRIGSTSVITSMCSYFGSSLKTKIPVIWEIMTDYINKNITEDRVIKLQNELINEEEVNELITSLQLIEIVTPNLDKVLQNELVSLLPQLCILLSYPFKVVRHLTARSLAVFASVKKVDVMDVVLDKIIPFLSSIENLLCRQGAAEAISCIVNKLQFEIIPYVVLLVVPLLGRMSDPDLSVRLISTQCFATLIQLMPLDGNAPDMRNELSVKLKTQKEHDRKFLDYLFTPKKIPDFKVPVKINAELRSYQQAGVNWLWFLNKYKLHGILCDDMGLGKTLQTICILAGDHYYRDEEKLNKIPSIVICPPTLTGHWVYEVQKFLPDNYLKPLHYVGLPVDREKLRHKVNNYNLVVASYDIVRKDIDFFKTINWNYCVLDEGHIIKNGKTKSSKAIKQLIANHRLILSGTPIQNNVLELWSLFDFLMPGFLGTEKQFMVKFSRPILASRDAKSSAKDQEAGALAMEALHRQVLPFLLRRVKEDVLTDLPPKITQDLLCDLSELQQKLYEDLSKTPLVNDDIKNCLENIDQEKLNRTHVFQALRYLQNVCNHPKLVLNQQHPEYQNIQSDLSKMNSSLDDIQHSGKLPVLKQLLMDCGIGVNDTLVNQHRALIFCQLKAMLDIIENDLFEKHLPAVTYLRLDGSVPASSRHDIVTKFNNDPSIDVLLLTTQVGGLGLNLTGADTVIFVEHDWNPMKDLQAMDRAHRIGQKKVVNVYRLITRKSLEEKIMGLQKFKLVTANTVVSDENASMETMGTEQLFDLFSLNDDGDKNKNNENKKSGSAVKNVLESLPELWDDKQYEEEYDLSQFLKQLK